MLTYKRHASCVHNAAQSLHQRCGSKQRCCNAQFSTNNACQWRSLTTRMSQPATHAEGGLLIWSSSVWDRPLSPSHSNRKSSRYGSGLSNLNSNTGPPTWAKRPATGRRHTTSHHQTAQGLPQQYQLRPGTAPVTYSFGDMNRTQNMPSTAQAPSATTSNGLEPESVQATPATFSEYHLTKHTSNTTTSRKTYTVQYVGLAQGELGVLSKKQAS